MKLGLSMVCFIVLLDFVLKKDSFMREIIFVAVFGRCKIMYPGRNLNSPSDTFVFACCRPFVLISNPVM